jgi:hypothetical protein
VHRSGIQTACVWWPTCILQPHCSLLPPTGTVARVGRVSPALITLPINCRKLNQTLALCIGFDKIHETCNSRPPCARIHMWGPQLCCPEYRLCTPSAVQKALLSLTAFQLTKVPAFRHRMADRGHHWPHAATRKWRRACLMYDYQCNFACPYYGTPQARQPYSNDHHICPLFRPAESDR